MRSLLPRNWVVILLMACLVGGCGERSDTVVAIALHPTKSNILYIATDEAVYKSRDTGATWKRLNGELSRTRVISLAIDPQLPANVFAGTNGDGTYKSPDGGRNWHQFNSGQQKGTILRLSIRWCLTLWEVIRCMPLRP